MTRSPARRFPLIVLAYLGPCAVIPLVLACRARADVEVCWHAWHGLLLAMTTVLLVGGLATLAGVLGLSNVAAGLALGIVSWLAWAGALAVHLGAMAAGLSGSRVRVPGLGSLASRLAGR